VPLEVYVSKFAHMRFESSGMTNDPDIRAARSSALLCSQNSASIRAVRHRFLEWPN